MHIRQVALVARDLEPVVADLCAVFDVELASRDPGVAAFGLRNAVIPVGRTFLEVVSPVQAGTTAGRLLEKRGGDGGYMVILQTADLEADRQRLTTLSVRVVWQIALDDIATVHLHPRDVGGALVSLDKPRPPASWRWAGPEWEAHVRTGVVEGITSVTIAATDPAGMASRWAQVLARSPVQQSRAELPLELGVIRFVVADTRGEGIAAVGLAPVDAPRAFATARQRGLCVEGEGITIGGVRFDLAS